MAEKKYIDAEKLTGIFEDLKAKADSLKDCVYLDGVLSIIDVQPAADVVEVVRCKDCVHFTHARISDNIGCCKLFHVVLEKTDFCKRGKKMDGKDSNNGQP